VLRGVHRRSGLLRAGVATSGNEHRLGANEAPPAIVSVFLGERLTQILGTLIEGRSVSAVAAEVIQTGVEVLPAVRKDNTDRNRTSPFAFTGNKFEFRAVGSSQSSATPMTYLNLAVAEALDEMGAELKARVDAGEEITQAILAVVKEAYADAQPVVFNGDNYSEAWVQEAERRGLPHHRTTPEALGVLKEKDTKDLFERYRVLRAYEMEARWRIDLERYNRMLDIEAVQMLRMVKTGALPAAWRQQTLLADAVLKAEALGLECPAQREELALYSGLVQDAIRGVDAVRQALAGAPHEHDLGERAHHFSKVLRPAMARLRTTVDTLERRTDEALWPFPSYHQLLFQ